MPMPVEIVGLLRSTITFVWEDEHKSVYPARAAAPRLPLRAVHRGDDGQAAARSPRRCPQQIRARAINVVGNYAINIDWSDGHTAGIYNFRTLRADCPCDDCASAARRGQNAGVVLS